MLIALRTKLYELIARIKLALNSNISSVRYMPGDNNPPTEHELDNHYIRLHVSKYTGATSTLSEFLCHKGSVLTLEYLASLKYVGPSPIEVKFFRPTTEIEVPRLDYTAYAIIGVTEDDQIRSTPFLSELCAAFTYDDIVKRIRKHTAQDDKQITRWVIIYVNSVTSQWDMTLSSI